MSKFPKNGARAVALALAVGAVAPAASAGEWVLNPDRCPDLREDYRDMQRDRGWRDREEDRRDSRVIRCPAQAWSYQRDRFERGRPPPYPREVVIMDNGRVYERDRYGRLVNLGVDLNLGLGVRLG